MVVRPRVTTAEGQKARAALRSKIGKLSDLRIQGSTKKRYDLAVKRFFDHLEEFGWRLPKAVADFDSVVSEYIDHLWEDGAAVGTAGDTLSGLQHYETGLRHRLAGSWQRIGLWQRLELPTRSTPAWHDLVLAMASWALDDNNCGMAAALLLGWECLLRTGEIGGITLGSMTVLRGGSSVMIDLGWTKGAKRKKVVEEKTAVDPLGVALAIYLIEQGEPGDYLVPGGTRAFTKTFGQYLKRHSLNDLGLTPYSLRRGKATELWRSSGSVSVVQSAGRWSDMRTARLYIDGASAQLTELKVPEQTHKAIAKAAHKMRKF